MIIKPINTEQDYEQALERLEVIFDAKKGTAEGNELEVLGILIEKYEDEKFPIGLPDPVEAIKFRMEQLGYSPDDLAKLIGQKSKPGDILSRKKKLTLSIIRQLHDKLHIPTDVLIQAY